ncbi:type III-A CRISPR-associated RAMP protein Csm3 [[Mannheimia] succiniciproducens]|uniref:CRISPR system Cms endoribonuclease Csm3 n=1 Tax=Mannheimia succiniciproducens (strain KCTC 0769BP / MBEL55E) TaxID=221988 RepID=Q65S04_MANSM|nr:type III-A CRISPR-associated RAMP protein Csm3 [[Mannheimia] succiniciproducens]AAU38256.1 unknown [[Mannheimia] succiniciproducens MBEL55E]
MKLTNIIEIKAKLVLKTGLHIGAGDSEMHIGGIDNSVIKHSITQSPYIPGSSLKGKIRTLLEWYSGEVKSEPLSINNVASANNSENVKNILRLFGFAGHSENNKELCQELKSSRLAFWDCALNEDWEKMIREDNQLLTEAKSENTIDRITATAGNPRQTERVPAGAEFDFKLALRQFEGDSEELVKLVLKGLRLLELDSLGGSGSRGYGKVEFQGLTVGGKEEKLPENPFA